MQSRFSNHFPALICSRVSDLCKVLYGPWVEGTQTLQSLCLSPPKKIPQLSNLLFLTFQPALAGHESWNTISFRFLGSFKSHESNSLGEFYSRIFGSSILQKQPRALCTSPSPGKERVCWAVWRETSPDNSSHLRSQEAVISKVWELHKWRYGLSSWWRSLKDWLIKSFAAYSEPCWGSLGHCKSLKIRKHGVATFQCASDAMCPDLRLTGLETSWAVTSVWCKHLKQLDTAQDWSENSKRVAQMGAVSVPL